MCCIYANMRANFGNEKLRKNRVTMNNSSINNNYYYYSPTHIMFKAQKLVTLNTCSIVRHYLSDEFHLFGDKTQNS